MGGTFIIHVSKLEESKMLLFFATELYDYKFSFICLQASISHNLCNTERKMAMSDGTYEHRERSTE